MATDEFAKQLTALLVKFPEQSKGFEVVDTPDGAEMPKPQASEKRCLRYGRRRDGTIYCIEWEA